jgi:hypothetical protein
MKPIWNHKNQNVRDQIQTKSKRISNLDKRRDQLTMIYFDNLNNGPLNKCKKNLKFVFYKCVILHLD